MDRRCRRYVPASEGLEGRQLLSSATVNPLSSTVVNSANGVQTGASPNAPQTIENKQLRIHNLPYFIGLLNKDGVVPQPTVENIQNDLNSVVASLHRAEVSLVNTFNRDLRKAIPHEHILPTDAQTLNRDFGAVLVSAGASAATTTNLQAQMNALTQFASTQPSSSVVATNDYATVLQLALESGRPLVYPNTPNLLGSDHQGNHGKIPITHNHHPSLTGNYIAGTNIQIVDEHNTKVLGMAAVDPKTNVYTVKFNEKLPDGTYTIRVRAEDAGYVSDPSPKFTFEVMTEPPKKK